MSSDMNNETQILSLLSNSYDIVLNGVEIGGGAIRISNNKVQNHIFKILGLNDHEIQKSFG
jgi:aspartyl-tRNA synthetase